MLNMGGLPRVSQHAEGVFKTRVLGTRKNQVIQAQLPAMPQSLKQRMVDDRQIFADLDRPGTWYADRFHRISN